jgi:hypothetical protein
LTHLAHEREVLAILGTFIALANGANKIASETDKQFFEQGQSRIKHLELAVAGLKKTRGSDLGWRRLK